MNRKTKKAMELIVKKEGLEKLFENLLVSEFELLKNAWNILSDIPDYEFEKDELSVYEDIRKEYWKHSSVGC